MHTNIFLIDFENVQPDSFGTLGQDNVRVLVFVGASQTKVPFETAAALQQLGAKAEYIKIAGSGSNALDFHIAFYIGLLAAENPSACFHIVSKDTGFDPLINHLAAKQIVARRIKQVTHIAEDRNAVQRALDERVEEVLEKLRRPKATKPRTVKTLANLVSSYFQKQLSVEDVNQIIERMVQRGAISLDGTKVRYAAEQDA